MSKGPAIWNRRAVQEGKGPSNDRANHNEDRRRRHADTWCLRAGGCRRPAAEGRPPASGRKMRLLRPRHGQGAKDGSVSAGSVQLSRGPESHSGKGDPAASATVLQTVHDLKLDRGCIFADRPDTPHAQRYLPFDYFLSAGKLPEKPVPGAECIEFSSDELRVSPPPGLPNHPKRSVTAGNTRISPYYGKQDAENAVALLKWRGATAACSVIAQTAAIVCVKAPCNQPRGPIVSYMVSGRR